MATDGRLSVQLTSTLLFDKNGNAHSIRRPHFFLVVVQGPDKRRQKVCTSRRAVIGRADNAEFQLSDSAVSKLHCAVEVTPLGARLKDLNSTNGVRLLSRRVSDGYLEHGDIFELGKTRIRFEWRDSADEFELTHRNGFHGLVGSSSVMREFYVELERAARSDATVLLSGETGSGKELAAEALVAASEREGPLVVFDCRAGHALLEAELFGHEVGAFTGAERRRPGVFERANRGTLILDEVGELPKELQPLLLGALARGRVTPLGAKEEIAFDVRVVALTHHDLEREVNRGTFRADLFYRLAVLRLRMPSLSEHPEDIPQLVTHFLKDIGSKKPFNAKQLEALYEGDYPGNVRELRNAVERMVAGVVEPELRRARGFPIDLKKKLRPQRDALAAAFERDFLSALLAECEGNVSEVSRRSGVSRVHLYELLSKYRLHEP